jgi:hypothetical protein
MWKPELRFEPQVENCQWQFEESLLNQAQSSLLLLRAENDESQDMPVPIFWEREGFRHSCSSSGQVPPDCGQAMKTQTATGSFRPLGFEFILSVAQI